jgi:ankyrin repeat protein
MMTRRITELVFAFGLLLVSAATVVDGQEADGMTALHRAAQKDDAALGLKLLKEGADATAKNRYGITPLYLACVSGNGELVAGLLAAGADANTEIAGGETALMTASRTGNAGAVRALIEAGAKIDAREQAGQTALMWAAAAGNGEAVEALLKAGADFKISLKRSGLTALLFAVREGHADVVQQLLAAGADVNGVTSPESNGGKLPKRGTAPLTLAVENGHFDLAVQLLDAGADPNDMRSGYSVLHTMTWIRKPDIGETEDGDPAPLGSGRRNSLQFVREIVKRGADVNARLKRGRRAGGARFSEIGATPLLLAADRADLEYMKLLVELGADPLLGNEDGTTSFLVAAGIGSAAPEEEAGNEEECLAAVKYLVSLGADINSVDKRGETAMHGAAYKNIPSMVNYLNENGAEMSIWNTKNKEGRTPLMIAQGNRPGNFKPDQKTIDVIAAVIAKSKE